MKKHSRDKIYKELVDAEVHEDILENIAGLFVSDMFVGGDTIQEDINDLEEYGISKETRKRLMDLLIVVWGGKILSNEYHYC